jgi:dipeptidyl aminopeptidase/acylaminoacyl peptidase
VPHNQSEILYKALKNAGVEASFYTVKGGGHGGFRDRNVQPLVTEFFRRHLRN